MKFSYLFANFAVRTPALIDEMRTAQLLLTDQLNEMAQKMTEKLRKAISEGKDLSTFTQPGLGDEFPTMTLDEVNEYATKLRAKGGHLFTARDIFSILPDIAECIQRMSFLALKAPPGLFFVTSDRPLVFQSSISGSRVGAGWGKSDA